MKRKQSVRTCSEQAAFTRAANIPGHIAKRRISREEMDKLLAQRQQDAAHKRQRQEGSSANA